MDTRARLLAAAEQLFDQQGFTRTGMDQLAQAADMSSRTLYKHASSKSDLIAAVLVERERRFMQGMQVNSVDAMFQALARWMRQEGSRGCLFLRAMAETGGQLPLVVEVVTSHKARLAKKIRQVVALETRGKGGPALARQILILFEGATAASAYQGSAAVSTARLAAAALIEQVRS